MLPKTFKEMEKWDGQELPPEEVFAAFYYDFKVLVEKQEHGKLGQRLNKEKNGFNSITKKLFRQVKRKKIDESISIKEQINGKKLKKIFYPRLRQTLIKLTSLII